MHWKLALGNVKKSYREYSIYFITLAFSVCLFYTFHSFDAQSTALNMNEMQRDLLKNLSVLMSVLSVFVAFLFGFLILYASRFLILRRKKELGLYLLLGMHKGQVSRILMAETLLVGCGSLVAGLLAGVVVSQLMLYGTVRYLGVGGAFQFLFSPAAALKTVLCFVVIFLVVMLFHLRILRKYNLTDFWQAQSKNESVKLLHPVVSVFLFFSCIAVTGLCYYLAGLPLNYFMQVLWPVVLLGALGTLLFFMSLSGFLLLMTRGSKSFYYKNLHLFAIRQITSKLRTNYWTMTFVCILQVLAIGAFAVGIGTSVNLQRAVEETTPFDYSYWADEPAPESHKEMSAQLARLNGTKEQTQLTIYKSNRMEKELLSLAPGKNGSAFIGSPKRNIGVVSVRELNRVLQMQGLPPVHLNRGEAYLFTGLDNELRALNSIVGKEHNFRLFSSELRIMNREVPLLTLSTSSQMVQGACFAVHDEDIPKNAQVTRWIFNANLAGGVQAEKFADAVSDNVSKYNSQWEKKDKRRLPVSAGKSREQLLSQTREMKVMFTYMGGYLGTVFLICGAVVLALQQLSQASDSRKRYLVLNKMGAPQRMCRQSLLIQIGFSFFLPLALAAIHSIAGIGMMNSAMVVLGSNAIWGTALMTGGIVVLIYGIYFWITYTGCKRILKQK